MYNAKTGTIRLTEGELKSYIRGAVKQYINEGTTDTSIQERWDDIKRLLGAEGFLDEIYAQLSEDEIIDIIDYTERMYDIDYFRELNSSETEDDELELDDEDEEDFE